jgi:hypothetical protein
MTTSWQTEAGHLICRWSGMVQPVQYDPSRSPANIQGTYYLPPLVVDFASHSPFGAACWFHPRPADCHRRMGREVLLTPTFTRS